MFKEKKWSNRIQLILLFVCFLAPIVGAYYAYMTRDSREFNTVNNGQLYAKPQDLENIEFQWSNGQSQQFEDFDKRWYLVVVADGQCDSVCEQNLEKIARVRAMNGKNIARVVSLLVHDGLPNAQSTDLLAKYGIHGLSTNDSEGFKAWLKPFYEARNQGQFEADRIYIIDPLKKLMMSYPSDTDPKGLYQDLKRLLKVSQVG